MLHEFYAPCTVEEAENETQALQKIKSQDFDLIFLDINIPGVNTLDLLGYILIIKPAIKVLIFSMNHEKMYAKRYLDAGAMGFVSKDAPLDEMKKAINVIANNRKYYSEGLIESLINQKSDLTNSNPFEKLTEREFEIAKLFLEGKSLTEISTILHIQRSTTGTHKAKIFEKLNVHNMVEFIELSKIYTLK